MYHSENERYFRKRQTYIGLHTETENELETLLMKQVGYRPPDQ